jgi:hypothetical protein
VHLQVLALYLLFHRINLGHYAGEVQVMTFLPVMGFEVVDIIRVELDGRREEAGRRS